MPLDRPPISQLNESLIELCYAKFQDYYGKSCWVSNYPTWSRLTNEDKQFWTQLIMGCRNGFKKEIAHAMNHEPAPLDQAV